MPPGPSSDVVGGAFSGPEGHGAGHGLTRCCPRSATFRRSSSTGSVADPSLLPMRPHTPDSAPRATRGFLVLAAAETMVA